MLSVIIATRDSERPLVRTLAALVPGATSGLITEVLIADGGSRDDTPAVADIAGCKLLADAEEPLGHRLRAAAEAARAPWLMFLQPGIVLDTPWIGETRSFVERPILDHRAAVFRHARPGQSAFAEAAALVAGALGARPRPEQGLVVAADFYQQTGGHSRQARDPESDLLRRIGGRRLARLSTRAFRTNT
jgi:glycosyltransferase involved in cell wall biosynthesis